MAKSDTDGSQKKQKRGLIKGLILFRKKEKKEITIRREAGEKERNQGLQTKTFQKVAQEEKTTRRRLSSIKRYLESQLKILRMPALP